MVTVLAKGIYSTVKFVKEIIDLQKKMEYTNEIINIKKPRVYIEIWALQGGFDISQQHERTDKPASIGRNEMVLKAKMSGHLGIFESDVMKIANSPLTKTLSGKKKMKSVKKTIAKIVKTSQDRRFNFIRPIGVQIEHASIYGKKAEISFSDPDGLLNSVLNTGDLIYIYTYNEGDQRKFRDIRTIKGKGKAELLKVFYPELDTTYFKQFKFEKSEDKAPGFDLNDDRFVSTITTFSLDFSGVITTHRQDISSSQQCRLEAVDGLKIFQHINVSTKLQRMIKTSMKDDIEEDHRTTNNWVINDFTLLLIKAMYFCLATKNDREWFEFLYVGRLDEVYDGKFQNRFTRSSFKAHYDSVVQIVEVVGNNVHGNKRGNRVAVSHIFIAHPYVWIKALMIYINEMGNLISNFKINVVIPIEYEEIFDGYLSSIIQNLSFQKSNDDVSDHTTDDKISHSKAKKLLKENYRHIPLPDLLLGATFYNNNEDIDSDKDKAKPHVDWGAIFEQNEKSYADRFDLSHYNKMIKFLAFVYTSNSGFSDTLEYTPVIANQLQLHINPVNFDYNGIITICENFLVRENRSYDKGILYRQQRHFLNLIQRFSSNFVDLIMTNPISIRSSKFNAKNTMYSEKTGKSNVDPTSSIPIPQLLQYAFGWFNPEPFYHFPFEIDNDEKDRDKKDSNYMYDISQSTWVQSDFYIRTGFKNAAVYLIFFPVMTSTYTNRYKVDLSKRKNITYIKYIPLSEVLEVDLTTMTTNNNFLIITADKSDGFDFYNEGEEGLYNSYYNDLIYFDKKNRKGVDDFWGSDKNINKNIKLQLFQENLIRKNEINYRRRMEQFLYNHAPRNERMRQPFGFGDWLGVDTRDVDEAVDSKQDSVPMDRVVFDESDEITYAQMKATKVSRVDPDRWDLFNWSDVEFNDNDFKALDDSKEPKHNSETPPFNIILTHTDDNQNKEIIIPTVFGGIPKSLSTADLVKYIDSKFANIPDDIYDQIRTITRFEFNHDPLTYAGKDIDRGQSVSLGVLRKQMISVMKTTRKIMPTLPYDVILLPYKIPDEIWDYFGGDRFGGLVINMIDNPLYKAVKRIIRGIHLKGDEISDIVGNEKVLNTYVSESGYEVTVKVRLIKENMYAGKLPHLSDDIVAFAKKFSYLDHINRVNNIMQTLASIDIFMKVVLSRASIGGKIYLKNWGRRKIRVGQEIGLIDDRLRVPLDAFPSDNMTLGEKGLLITKKTMYSAIREVKGSIKALLDLQDKIRRFIEIQDKITHHEPLRSSDDYIFASSIKSQDLRSSQFFVWKTVTYIGQSSSSAGSTSGYTQKVYMSDMSVFWNNKFEEDDFVSRMAEELIGRGFPLIEPSVFEENQD